MTTDQLRANLVAHGVDGDPLHPGWHVVESADGAIGFCVVIRDRGGSDWTTVGFSSTSVGIMVRGFVRHAPLPDFGAMARELAELRAKVEDLDMRARTMCIDCYGTGEGEGEGELCDTCDGRKWVYHRRADWVTP